MDHPQPMNLTKWCSLVCSAAGTAKKCCPLYNAVCYDKCPVTSSEIESSPFKISADSTLMTDLSNYLIPEMPMYKLVLRDWMEGQER